MAVGTRTYHKWANIIAIPGILAILMLFGACSQDTIQVSFRPNDFVAIAFPAELPSSEVVAFLARNGIDNIVNEDSLMVPMTDFVRLDYLALADLSRRVQADDPRQTPLTSLLASSFTTTVADDLWRIWYVPVESNAIYKVIQKVFAEIGGNWAWDAQAPSPALGFLWIIWLAWIVWLLASKPVKDRLYHGLLIAAWIPVAFTHTVPSAALMVVGQGISAILGMHTLAGGRKYHIDSDGIRKLLVSLAPFLLSLLFLVSIDTELLIPAIASLAILTSLIVYKEPIASLLDKRRLHRHPSFRLILDETLRKKATSLGRWTLVPLFVMISLILLIPFRPGDHSAYQLIFSKDQQQSLYSADYANLIRSHILFQEALAWGRLGEASWLVEGYTRPFRFELLEDKIVRGQVDHGSNAENFQNSNELDKELRRILEHTKAGAPRVVTGADIPRKMTIQLDSLGVVFYIMALAPFCLLGLHWASQSRRRIITSYLNRQVA